MLFLLWFSLAFSRSNFKRVGDNTAFSEVSLAVTKIDDCLGLFSEICSSFFYMSTYKKLIIQTS